MRDLPCSPLAAAPDHVGCYRNTAVDEENGFKIFEFHDVLSNDAEDRRSVLVSAVGRENMLVVCLAEGKSLRDAARVLGMGDSTTQAVKRDLGLRILEFMGPDIHVQVQRLPGWTKDLAAIKDGVPE